MQSNSDRLAEIAKWLPTAQRVVLGSGRGLGGGVVQIILSLLTVFLFYRDGETVSNRLSVAIRESAAPKAVTLPHIPGGTMRAFVYGVLGTALLQGVPAGLGFMVAGVHGAVLLGFLTFVVAVIPGGPVLVAVDLVSARTQSIRGKTGAPCGIRLPRR